MVYLAECKKAAKMGSFVSILPTEGVLTLQAGPSTVRDNHTDHTNWALGVKHAWTRYGSPRISRS